MICTIKALIKLAVFILGVGELINVEGVEEHHSSDPPGARVLRAVPLELVLVGLAHGSLEVVYE